MGSDRRDDKGDEVHRTAPVFGAAATGGPLAEADGPSEESANRSPAPISSPVPASGAELPSVIEPGAVLLNKYRVLEEIGRGGMGAVWLVEHMDLGEKRALKVIHAIVAADPRVRDRFKQEAKILAKLRHPNAVSVYDTGVVGQVAFIDMEYLEGQTLRELLKPGEPIPIAEIEWLLKRVCEVLARAHAQGIVHRDLKPENIMIVSDPPSGRRELKVLDFGIAKIVQGGGDNGPGLTLHTEGLLGTPAYSSPEQNDIDPETKHRLAIDGRSDIYSLGVILFEMLTGCRPFKGGHAQLLCQHAQVEPPRFKEVAPELDIAPALEAVVRRCLEKSPDNRPQSAHELYDQFSRAIQVPVGAELPSVIEPGAVLLNKYRVLEEIGRGGMGAVWLVEHMDLREKRALKVIHTIVPADPRVRDRFKQEAQILASLRHPNAVFVHDTGVVGQVAFIDMEYLEGQTLRELLKPGKPIPIAEIEWVLKEVCEVLARAHAQGIVHRDLKPENIMIVSDPPNGQPKLKVLDFGIAKIVQGGGDNGPGLTLNTGGLLGTPAYSSPEQNDIDPETKHRLAIDGRSDIYSLGVILFEMLTGCRPFKGGHAQLLCQHAQVEPPRFEEVAPELDIAPALEAVVRRCLEKSPDNRPQSARELYDQFSRAMPGGLARLWPAWLTFARLWPTWLTRRKAAVLVLLLLLCFLVWLAWKPHRILPEVTEFLAKAGFQPARETEKPHRIPPEVTEFLTKAGFRPAQETGIAEVGWPTAIVRSKGVPRTLILHESLYLPGGYEPESEGTESGLPRVLKSNHGVRFIQIPGDSFMMGALDNSDTYAPEERPSHRVTLSTFYLQENETTIEEFDRFCKETNRRPDDPELQRYYLVRNVPPRGDGRGGLPQAPGLWGLA